MLIQLASYLLLLALVLRFSPRWVELIRALRDDRQHKVLTAQMDWDRPARLRSRQGSSWRFWE